MILKEYRVDEQKGLKGQSNCGMPNAECGINQAKLRTPNYELRTSAIHSPQSMGMTLIEIIMVMVIIGILSVFLIPKFNLDYSSEAALNGAAYLIASDIRYAQEFAMANKVSKSVLFTSGSSDYTFSPTHNLDTSGQLPSGVTITNNFTVTFNSLGEPTTGGGGSVAISGGGLAKTISVVNYTGKVNIS
jgi:prepilin-type N-terminal cleavage/methylation domain-containing protein